MFFLGFDPGKRGAVAIIRDGEAYAFPIKKIREICETYEGICIATVEAVHAMPHQGVTSCFTFGEGLGYIKGMLDAFQIPYKTVPPQVWKKEFGVTADKKTSIWKCEELYPGLNLYPTKRSRTKSDGMAEAVLIATYGMKHYERRADDTGTDNS